MGVFVFFYPPRWGPCRVDVGGKNTSKRIVIEMEWEICLPVSKLCRWEEEMTMESCSPLAGADVASDTMETNTALATRGSALQSEIVMTSMEGPDYCLANRYSAIQARGAAL